MLMDSREAWTLSETSSVAIMSNTLVESDWETIKLNAIHERSIIFKLQKWEHHVGKTPHLGVGGKCVPTHARVRLNALLGQITDPHACAASLCAQGL